MKHTYTLLFAMLFGFALQAQITQSGLPFPFDSDVDYRTDVITETMPPVDVEALMAEDAILDQEKSIPWRFGHNIEVDLGIGNAGEWEDLDGGHRLWRLRIKSPGAVSLNFQFDEFELPVGAKLFLASDDQRDVLGALTSDNNKPWGTLGTTLISGDAVTLEYFEPAGTAGQTKLNIGTVTHGYRSINLLPGDRIEGSNSRDLGDSGNCNNNVICPEGDDWRDQIRSVAMIVVGGGGICTGALVNNTCEDSIPYFLTADHCVGGNVSNWVFRFNWDSPTCTPTTNGPTNMTVSGATLRASNGNSDFALLEMSATPPDSYDVFWAGWDNSGTAPTSSVCVHHPSGDIKKITFDNDAATQTNFQGVAAWHISDWEDGTTEGGSSGSPLFNQNGLIIGQLYGGSASCGNNVDDYFGRFDLSWDAVAGNSNHLEPWLDGCNTGAVTLEGLGADAPTIAVDAQLQAIDNIDSWMCGETTADPEITIRNKGLSNLSSLNLRYQLDGGAVANVPWTGNLAYNESEVIYINPISFSDGAHTFTAWVENPNGQTDGNTSNDELTVDFTTVLDGDVFTLDLTTDYYGSEVTWMLEDEFGSVLAAGGPYGDSFTHTEVTEDFCLAAECYYFTIFDDAGDGMTGAFWDPQDGFYTITDGTGTAIVNEAGASYDFDQTHFFCAGGAFPFSVEELNSGFDFKLFPNPGSGMIYLQLNADQNEKASIRVMDLLGHQVHQQVESASAHATISMDLGALADGIYIVEVTLGNRTEVQRLVVGQ